MDIINSVLPSIEHVHFIGYWIALFAALCETIVGVGFFIPGSTIILFMGASATQGYLDIGDLIWFAAIGAIIGDNVNYFFGKKYGSKIVTKGLWFVKPKHFQKAEAFLEKHGAKSIFIGRFIPSVKETIPFIAGMFNMKRRIFMLWNILGAIGWSIAWIVPGYIFAQSLTIAEMWLTRTGVFLGILMIFGIGLYIAKILLIKKSQKLFSFFISIKNSIIQSLRDNTELQKFIKKHNRFFSFIFNRLDNKNFFGLPFTLLCIAFSYVLFLFGGIVEDIINSDTIISADVRIANILFIFRNDSLVHFFVWITLLGKIEIIALFIFAIIIILIMRNKKQYIGPMLLSVIGSGVFTYLGKYIFHRPRPTIAVYPENSFSFPSGHATIAVAFYGFVAYLLIKNTTSLKRKINILFVGIASIFLIGFSRLYLGVHYVSDVWGGYLAGGIWLIVSIGICEFFLRKNTVKNKENTAVFAPMTHVIGVLLIAVAGYIFFAIQYSIPTAVLPVENEKKVVHDPQTIFDSDQLHYTETVLGRQQEPISFIIIAHTDQELITAFSHAGWILADDVNISSMYMLIKAAIMDYSYDRAPMTPDFWNTAVHNFGFEKETVDSSVRMRHHARFWNTQFVTDNGDTIYVGTASFDNGIKWGITHKINPDIDTEREILFEDLNRTGLILQAQKNNFVPPKLGNNFSGDAFFTDGKVYVLSLKNN